MLAASGISLAAAFMAGVFTYRHRAKLRAYLGAVQGNTIIQTNLYNLRVRYVAIPAEGRDGGIDAFEDGILFANRRGQLWFVDSTLALHPLALRVPINVKEFEADPYNENTVSRDRFAVKDILVQRIPRGFRLLASHNHWNQESSCNTLRVSSIETTLEELRSPAAGHQWETVFESQPCRPLTEQPNGKYRNPTLAAGGRLVALSADEVLLSVGGFGPETRTGPSTNAGGGEHSYGKVLRIDVATRTSRPYSVGHRNPQGLAIGPNGDVWETEHAARGGDELNLLRDGANYGYPYVSYGTEYGSMAWSGNPRQGRHDGYEKPKFAWVPSIGISNLLVLRGNAFAHWAGDLFVSSLNAQTLFRVRVEDGRVIFVEPIRVEQRIRDVAEAADGRIVLKSDDNLLVYLSSADAASAENKDLKPAERGAILGSQCAGCHAFAQGGTDGLGPNLWGVVGRRIAGREQFNYSPALRAQRGQWTPERLREFLTDPATFAPGTSMQLTAPLHDAQIADLIAYLQTLR